MGQYDVWEHKQGLVAEKTEWTTDFENGIGTIVYTIRQGMNYGLNPNVEASRMVGGRELTTDDVLIHMTRMVTETMAYVYRTNHPLREAVITKTGPWEITVKLPIDALITGIFRFGALTQIFPAELADADLTGWKNATAGTGPYILMDSVPASTAIMERNPAYWMKNPVGPGEGDQLPYIDKVRFLIIPDLSTRHAAIRTGKVDRMGGFEWEDAEMMRNTTQGLMERQTLPGRVSGSPESLDFPSDTPPFDDIRVRRALHMATDLGAIDQGLANGFGQLLNWPFPPTPGYEALYVGLDDPDTPESITELFVYNPEKAKELLAEAGYPNGFKTKALMTATTTDYWAIIKDQWAKVGVELELDVRDSGVRATMLAKGDYEGLTDGGTAPISVFHTTPTLTGTPSGPANTSHIFDPVIDQGLAEVRHLILTEGGNAGMVRMRELLLYVLPSAYAVPIPYVPKYMFWWPWLKGYSGEVTIGYFKDLGAQYIWIDQDLKRSMGF
ncbi:MAG: ABC transporter substrate-binding protein [Dehalococcoidales bacterium]